MKLINNLSKLTLALTLTAASIAPSMSQEIKVEAAKKKVTKKTNKKKPSKKVSKKTKTNNKKKKPTTKKKTKAKTKKKAKKAKYLDQGDKFKKTNAHHLNVTPKLAYRLSGLLTRVVQKHYIDHNQIYALQLKRNEVVIQNALKKKNTKFANLNKAVTLPGDRHTQTLEKDTGDMWFVGVTPKKVKEHAEFVWTTEIGRFHYRAGQLDQTQMPRLTDLEKASDDKYYTADQLERVEATVSPNKHYLLINSVQYPQGASKLQTVHFALYDLATINARLDQAENSDSKTVSLATIKPIKAFHIKNAIGSKLSSLQGLAIDNKLNIYISCQNPPKKIFAGYQEIVKQINQDQPTDSDSQVKANDQIDPDLTLDQTGSDTQTSENTDTATSKADSKKTQTITIKKKVYEWRSAFPREIVRIPWGKTNSRTWTYAKVNAKDWNNKVTEFEGIQIIGKHLYLNVSFHNKKTYRTYENTIYDVPKIVR